MVKLLERPTHTGIIGDAEDLAELKEWFAFDVPMAWRTPSHVLWKRTSKQSKPNGHVGAWPMGWDGRFYPLKVKGSAGLILRGHTPEVLQACKKLGIEVSGESTYLANPFSQVTEDDLPPQIIDTGFELDEHQRACIVAWLRKGYGINMMSVAAGKTATFAETAAIIKARLPKARFLYVTPSERLVNSVVKEIKRWLPSWDVTQFGGGKNDNTGEDMVVCTIAMLNRHLKSLRKDFFPSITALLADECQFFTSDSGEAIALACPARFRFAASDTLKEDDVVKFTLLRGLFGQILKKVDAAPLIKSGRIAVPHISIVDIETWNNKFNTVTNTAAIGSPAWALIDGSWKKGTYGGPEFKLDKDGEVEFAKKTGLPIQLPGYHKIAIGGDLKTFESRHCLLNRLNDRGIIQFRERNELICRWTKYYATDRGLRTLVVATRTIHVMMLAKMLEDYLDPKLIRTLYGDSSTKERDTVFQWFRDTPGAVLVTPLVKVGVSINEIEAGVVADRVADWEYARQIIGRFIRKKAEGTVNEAHITWFFDRQHAKFRKVSKDLFDRLSKEATSFNFLYPVTEPGTEKHAITW